MTLLTILKKFGSSGFTAFWGNNSDIVVKENYYNIILRIMLKNVKYNKETQNFIAFLLVLICVL